MSVSFLTPSFDAPADVTRSPIEGSLAHDLASATTTAALTFAGQGWRWWEDLDALLARRPWLRDRARRWSDRVVELSSTAALVDLAALRHGFDPLRWIDDPRTRPDDGELSALAVSMPGVLLTQLLAYREAWEDGLSRAVEAGSVVAATGHSGGIIAAAAVAARPDGLDDDAAVSSFLELAVVLGHVVGTSEHAVPSSGLTSALQGDVDARTPMVAVAGVRLDRLADLLDADEAPGAARIALRHAHSRAVISGSPAGLEVARAAIAAAVRTEPGGGRLVWEPLAVSAPCHHPVLTDVAEAVVVAAREADVVLPRPTSDIALVLPDGPRVAPVDGDLARELVEVMLVRPGRWDRTSTALVTGSVGSRPAQWLIDLGPSVGVARLAQGATHGTGAAVLAMSSDEDRRALVAAGATDGRVRPTYERFAPRLVRLPDGSVQLENHFTRTTGRSPIVLAGMTPTTVDAPIVAAAANAGFVAELAGGGQVTEAIFAERMTELGELLEPGAEIVLNTLHLDPYLWCLHLGRNRLVQTARRAGAPICGVTISAGIPDTDAAVELLDELTGLGMWCNAFKPGTLEQLRQVAAIAAAAPQHTVMVHVEGGQAGGHHSWVELDDLLLAGYRELRSHDNVVLCAGGGVGTPERAAELLTGRWALRHGDVAMPVDGVLIGTAAMAAAEATASPGVKAALVDAPGIGTRVARGSVGGGVTSGRSGLDADIHFLDNAASRCAALLDEVAGDADAVDRRHDEIVAALATTAKPWFGDVAAMTYERLLRRFVELTALGRDGRYDDGAWLDRTHRDRFVTLLQRAEARLHPEQSGTIPTAFAASSSVDDPTAAVDLLVDRYPDATTTRLHPADPDFFLHVCRTPGKPVPFVPVLDGDVRRWYQSDSLWQAQHPAYDADQVLIIPGPAAVTGITSADEPIASLLSRFEQPLRDELAGAVPAEVTRRRRRTAASGGDVAALAGPVAALLAAPTVVIDGAVRPNPVHGLAEPDGWRLTPGPDGRLVAAELRAVSSASAARGEACPVGESESVELLAGEPGTSDADAVTLTITWPALRRYGADPAESGPGAADESVSLRFVHDLHHGADVLTLDTSARRDELSTLLHDVLVGDTSGQPTVDPVRRRRHAALLGLDATATPLPDSLLAVVWPEVFRCLGDDAVVGSLLDLVHLEHRVRILDADALAAAGDLAGDTSDGPVSVAAQLTSTEPHEAGTRVDTCATIAASDGRPIAVVSGAFLLRGVEVERTEPLHADADAAERAGTDVPADLQERPRLTLPELVLRAPEDLRQFAVISGDHNPIHRSTAVARFVGLDGPIVHGAWTSAGAQRALVESACGGRAERLVDISVSFVGVVLPGDEVRYAVTRLGVVEGDTEYGVTATVSRAEGPVPVLTARARVRPPRTAYLFPGQGIQRQGMGMDGYERSAAARDVWDRADAHTRSRLGFSILSIVRDNPTVVAVASPDGDAEVHRHPLGVLHLTQFTQVAMAALAMAQFAELRDEGVVDESAVVAGHSVGEYNALASLGGVLPLEVIVELVFRRGQSMHHLVPRDAAGRSDYRLGVIRPHQVDMDHAQVEELVRDLAARLGETLEIVNYNLRGKQYAVAGTLQSLDALEATLDARRGPTSKDPFLYVPGIDVPFHSAVLRDGVADFRSHLDAGLPERIDPALLVGRYVPNLVPRPFTLERGYVEEVADHVGSEMLADVLADWDRRTQDPGRLCRDLLVELLAWQFASPVRWIETQDLLVTPIDQGGLGVERIVEVGLGSQPTVANLAKGTLAMRPAGAPEVVVLNVEADRLVVAALDEDPEPVELPDETADAPDASDASAAPAAEPAPAATATATPASSNGTTSGPVEDRPVDAGTALRLLLALLVKVRPDQLSGTETIDDLVDGVSSRRNQLLMDLGTEFAVSGMDGARELPLDTLSTEIAGRVGRYRFPGVVLRDARDSALTSVLGPLRIKARDVEARVTGHWGLGAGWADRVLTTLAFEGRRGDSTRGGPIGRLSPLPSSADDAVDAAVALSASDLGVQLADPSASGGGSTVDAAAVADLEARLAGPDGLLASMARDVLDRVAPASGSIDTVDDAATRRLALLDAEHGERRATAVRPLFDPQRHVAFSSWWATARHDVVALRHAGAADDESLDDEAARLARYAEDPGVAAAARWFADRAADRGDPAAVARFERILAGGTWTPPVAPLRPSLDDAGRFTEAADSPDRVAQLVDLVRATNDGGWIDPWVEQLERGLPGSSSPSVRPGRREVALVTGASPGSIAFEVVRRLLADGAAVVCTTTDDGPERMDRYRELYRVAAAPGAELHVVRANLASFSDVDDLVDWMVHPVTDSTGGVTRTLKDPMLPTLVIPFAAGPVAGDLVDVDGSTEVALRVLLLGVERLLGAVAAAQEQLGDAGRRATVVLPMSPNQGGFGGDGAYGEAKAALEVVVEKWTSERRRWGGRLDMVAATIGWVRGTGLMDANDAMGALVERELGVRTFSAAEMGWLLHGLCTPTVREAAGGAPVRVDLSGGLGRVGNLHDAVAPLVRTLERFEAERVAAEPDHDGGATPDDGSTIGALLDPPSGSPGRIDDGWRPDPVLDLDDMVVVVGAGELGPWGGSATRFDLEVDGDLDDGSVAELAWTCGLIRWDPETDGGSWIDVELDEVVAEGDLARRYRAEVHERCGIRTFDADGPLDPDGVSLVVEVFCDRDVVVDVADESDARAFAAADPEHTDVRRSPSGDWQVVRRAGSTIRVPRRAELSRTVGGQVPAGFDPSRWGIPAEMVASVDRLSLWNLVATVEAFLDAGIEPEELMARVHPARVGNTQGSGMGGMSSIQTLYRDTVLGGDHANDLLQEGLGNVIAAYVVQSYVGSYGPMVHPVAACATAAVSIEDAVDKIRAGKADVVVAGGWDDLGLEGVLGFAAMSATAKTAEMTARGMVPERFSRANDRRRGGFVEAQGGGTLLLARASVAADLGLPVRGVVVHASSHADGIHTSIPAPGLGALACALGGRRSPLARSLAEHGLTADDIAVVSKHDTSTAANDPNESELHQRIADQLGRSPGNPMLVVSQKTVTGHAKGGAAAWQAIGLLQVLETSRVPGNRNLECLDVDHRDHTHLAYGHRTVHLAERPRAGLLTSLGFGHVSAVLCLGATEIFDAALERDASPDAVRAYRRRAAARRTDGRRRRLEGRFGGEPAYTKRTDRRLVGEDGSPARREAEASLLTDRTARLGDDGTYVGADRADDGIPAGGA